MSDGLMRKIGDVLLGRFTIAEADVTPEEVTRKEREIDDRLARVKERAWAKLQREV